MAKNATNNGMNKFKWHSPPFVFSNLDALQLARDRRKQTWLRLNEHSSSTFQTPSTKCTAVLALMISYSLTTRQRMKAKVLHDQVTSHPSTNPSGAVQVGDRWKRSYRNPIPEIGFGGESEPHTIGNPMIPPYASYPRMILYVPCRARSSLLSTGCCQRPSQH